jgi:hypothetical protein
MIAYIYISVSACVWVRSHGEVRVGVREQAWVCACTCVALLIQHGKRRHIAIYGLSGSTTFFTFSHKLHDFGKTLLT